MVGLLRVVHDRVAVLTLDRPDRLNTLTVELMGVLIDELDRCSRDEDVWVVLLTGAGERAFCAGVDLSELRSTDSASGVPAGAVRDRALALFEAVLGCAKPVVAAVNGVAVGAGFELALAADIRIAAAGTRFGLPESKRGLGATFGSLQLPRLVPRGVAYEMLYTGELMTAEDALRWGLLNRVLPGHELAAYALGFCTELTRNAPLSLQRYRAMIRNGAALPIDEAVLLSVGPDPYTSSDHVEGIAAFLEKRPPVWMGR
jgi:enoyl-CoA hydratase